LQKNRKNRRAFHASPLKTLDFSKSGQKRFNHPRGIVSKAEKCGRERLLEALGLILE